MLAELVLFATFAVHHLIIGSLLYLVLMAVSQLKNISSEMLSWLWLTAFLIATLSPFSLFVDGEKAYPSRQKQVSISSSKDVIKLVDVKQIKLTQPTNYLTLTEQSPQWNLPEDWVVSGKYFLYVFLITWLLGSLWRVKNLAKTAQATYKLRRGELTQFDAKNLTVNSLAPLFISNKTTTPMVIGLLKPIIIIPESFTKALDAKQLEPIILHEFAHIQRKDLWFGLLQELLAVIFWWSPVVRLLNRKIHMTRELACDLRAANQLNNGKVFAQSLLDCAKVMLTKKQNVLAMGLFSQKKDLKQRIEAVLKMKVKQKINVKLIAASCGLLALVTFSSAQGFMPKINVAKVESEVKKYTRLSRHDSEQLINAINQNKHATIEKMLSQGLDINTPMRGDGTALMLAVRNNNQTLVNMLINSGADVNQASQGDGNPLIIAAKRNHLALAKQLIEQGADVNAVVEDDETPLINASWRGHIEMTRLLVEQGADVNLGVRTSISDGFEFRTPLNKASSTSIKNYLITSGAIE